MDAHTGRSGIAFKSVYHAEDIPGTWSEALSSEPGRAPFLRGTYPEMYRAKPWRIFQLSGYGSPEEMAARLRFLLEQGETGFIMKRDRVTNDHLYDVDHPEVMARPEDVGQTGAVLLSARDVQIAFEGVPIDRSYAHPGAGVVQAGQFCLASYWVAAKRKGFDFTTLSGTGQSDFFLTYVGCPPKEQIPPRHGLRLNCDLIEFCTQHMPRWVPVSIAGYNGADSGLNCYEELGAVFANAIEYLDEFKAGGLSLMPWLEELEVSTSGHRWHSSRISPSSVRRARCGTICWRPLWDQRRAGSATADSRRHRGFGNDL